MKKILFDKNEIDKELEKHRLAHKLVKIKMGKKFFKLEPPSCYLSGPPLDFEDEQKFTDIEPTCYIMPPGIKDKMAENENSNTYKQKKLNELLKFKNAEVDIDAPEEEDSPDETDSDISDEE